MTDTPARTREPEQTELDTGLTVEADAVSPPGRPNTRSRNNRQRRRKRRRRRQSMKERMGMGEKRWKGLKGKERLVLVLPAVAIAVAVAAVLWMGRDAMRLTLEGKPCQYYGGSIYRLEAGSVLRRTSEGDTLLESGGRERQMDVLPIYDEAEAVITLPQDMVYYAPRSGRRGRLGYFTQIKIGAGGAVTALRDGKETPLEQGFLYDGEDLYLFLEPAVVSFNGYRLELPALSYVEAVYTGDVMVFDYGGKEFLLEAPTGAATAEMGGGDYTLALLGDSMTTHDGTRTLLFTRPELLDPVLDE